MRSFLRTNHVDGRDVEADSGAAFELASVRPPYESLGSWPRSAPRDVAAALDRLASARASPPRDRPRALARAAAELARRLDTRVAARETLARRLGVVAEELAAHTVALAARAREAIARERAVPHGRPGALVLATHWSELEAAAGVRLLAALATGRPVLWLPDPRVPMVADLWLDALERAGAGTIGLAVLHGADVAAVDAALASDAVGEVRAAGTRTELARFAERLRAREDVDAELAPVARRILRVREGEDPGERARFALRGAFGRARTLSGQLGGQIGRAVCDPVLFSRFSAALLETAASDPDLAHPVPLVDEGAARAVRAAWALGLDEGATLILGGETSPDPGSRGAAARTLRPTVFTNVEERMEIARWCDPAPVLCLSRSLVGRVAGG